MQIILKTSFVVILSLTVRIGLYRNVSSFEKKIKSITSSIQEGSSASKLDTYLIKLSDSLLTKDQEAILLFDIAGEYYKSKKYQQAQIYYYKSIKADSTVKSIVRNSLGLSYCYRKRSIKDSSLLFVDKAYELIEKLPESYYKTNAKYKMGFIYKDYGLSEKSLPLLLSAYDGFITVDDKKSLANVCNLIAFIHRLQGNKKRSLAYYHKGRYFREEQGDVQGLSLAYNNLGNGHKSLMQLDSSLYYYKKSLALKKENNYNKQGFTLHNIGTVYFLKGDVHNARRYYQEELTVKKSESDTTTLVYTYNELALIAIEERDFKNGKTYLDSAEVYIRGNNELSLRWNEIQKLLYKKKGDYFLAYQYLEAYLAIHKDVYNSNKAEVIIDSQEKYDTEKKVETINDLTFENIETSKLLTRRTFYLITTIILLIFALIGYIITRQRQKIKLQKKEMEDLEAFYQGQDNLKNTIGRDLHDIVKARYEGIRLMVSSLARSNDLQEDVRDITQEIVEANSHVRTLSHRLSPLDQRIEHSTLNQIIRSELNKFQMYSDIKVVLINDFPSEWNTLRLEMMNHLYGILMEAINNIRDHSEASEVILEPFNDGHTSGISISDNGVNKHRGYQDGIGIGNMKSRAKLMKGDITTKMQRNGFSVILNFPLKEHIQ